MHNFQPHRNAWVYRTAPEGDHIKAELYYAKGGINYATYKTESRGIWISLGPVNLEVTPTATVEKFGLSFDGKTKKLFLLPLGRANARALRQVAATLDADMPAIARLWPVDQDAAVADIRRTVGATTVEAERPAWAKVVEGGAK